jgi:hypothetical protein
VRIYRTPLGPEFAEGETALTAGQLLKITLGAGEYTLTGVFAGGNAVGPIKVTVAAGQVVRQDLVLDVP